MKKIVILVVLASNLALCQSTKSSGLNENYKDSINSTFLEYNNLILNQDFEKSMDFMIPDFFEIIPRSQMVLLMKRIYNNPELEFKLGKPKNIVISDKKEIEGKYYSEINYENDIKMKFNNAEKSDDEEENKLTQNLMKLTLEKTFGNGNVNYNEETEFYEIKAIKSAYGVSDDGKSNWKFVVVEKQQTQILEKILPKVLVDSL